MGQEDRRVDLLSQHGGNAGWVFTTELTAAFWAGLEVPPELAVIPAKRCWSGQISPDGVTEVLERYRPELLPLSESHLEEFGLAEYIATNYESVSDERRLFRRR